MSDTRFQAGLMGLALGLALGAQFGLLAVHIAAYQLRVRVEAIEKSLLPAEKSP